MGRIALLPDEVASQVAAGEVVERPASVVKELVENSLDAGAGRVEVAIGRGGSSLIRVLDDGCGMERDDALLSLERHATSKIRSGLDLARISTLGFRGEALPSIASVSRFRLVTRPPQVMEGTEVTVSGGKLGTVKVSGEAPGTLVEVRSLFYNLPARRKFLRSESTEANHVQHQLFLQAIGHPLVGFVYVREQGLVFQAPPAKALSDRIRDLRGSDFLSELLEIIPEEDNGIRLSGFLGRPGISRATRAEQVIFVNGRPIENTTVNQGLREGYHTALMRGQYPVTFLFLELDPAAVDVNVHPAKREVRFRDPQAVREAVTHAVRRTLEGNRQRWSATFSPPPASDQGARNGRASAPQTGPLLPPAEQFSLRRDWADLPVTGSASPNASAQAPDPPPKPEGEEGLDRPVRMPSDAAASNLVPSRESAAADSLDSEPAPVLPAPRILGVLGRLYVLMENESGLVLLDQHAAHERILFERLRSQMEREGVPGQRLLLPITVQVAPKDYDWIHCNLETLVRMGFALEPFGEGTLKIDAIPTFLQAGDPAGTVRHLVDELRSVTTATSRLRMGEDVIAKTVCRHAVKANDLLRGPEIEQLLRDLLACELPYCCPHGRPTMIQISFLELEKKFGRKK